MNIAAAAISIVAPATALAPPPAPSDALINSAIVSSDTSGRLSAVFAKAARHEPIVLGVFGGSITQGAKASDAAHRYADRVRTWLADRFPQTPVTLINAGIGATGSPYGCLRVQRDLLDHHPDLVILDFAVNDGPEPWMAQTYEGVLRQILRQPNAPAVLELFFMHENGANAQTLQQQLGAHYGLPMVSYRDALWPRIADGQMTWRQISPDEVHPNDWGHAFAADCVERALSRSIGPATRPAVTPLPPPLFSDTFAHTTLIDRAALAAHAGGGWAFDPAVNGLVGAVPGSTVTFEMNGSAAFVMFYRFRGDFGRARLTIDQRPPLVLDGWFPGTWGGYVETTVVRDLPPGKHALRIELLDEKDDHSNGHAFRLLGIGSAGGE